jgi:HEPN domain-containing protein
MRSLEEAQELLQAAKRDLQGLIGMLQLEEMFADELFGLHVQQAVEKLSKAWITALGHQFPYTHDLDRLFQQLEDLGCNVSDYWSLTDFTSFGVRFRYEALLTDSEPINRKETISQVQNLSEQVESVLQLLIVDPVEDE